jgi:hypothetical protein
MLTDFQKRVFPQLHGISSKFGTAISLLCGTVRIEQDKKNNRQNGRENEMILPWPGFPKNTISTHRYQVCLSLVASLLLRPVCRFL